MSARREGRSPAAGGEGPEERGAAPVGQGAGAPVGQGAGAPVGQGAGAPVGLVDADGAVRAAWAGTGLFVVVALAGVAAPALAPVVVVVDVGLFAAGCAAFLWAFGRALARSRTEEVSLAGVYGLAGAPGAVRRALFGALAVQVAVALVTAAIRPFTSLAFGILVPVFCLGVAGVWGARHARFPPRSSPGVRTGGGDGGG